MCVGALERLTHPYEQSASRRSVAEDGLVLLVERVFEPAIQLQIVAERECGAQIHDRIAVDHYGVRRIIEAAAGVSDGDGGRQADRPVVGQLAVQCLPWAAWQLEPEVAT